MDVIKHGLLSLLAFVLWIQGLTDGSGVTQTDILWEKQGNNATLRCSHTKGARYNQMYWYRQLPGETMKLIVFTTTSNTDFGDFNNGKFAATKPDAESGTFTVKNLEPEDKGLYFCAMYWYRQLPGEGMKEIVYTTTTPPHKYESGFSEDKFPATKSDPQTGSLTVEKLLPEDSGVYFCAVSQHSDSGLTDGSGVTQTDILWEKQGDNATMSCSHTKGVGYNQMYWYRQLPGETMKLIVLTRLGNEDHDFGEFKGDKFAATKPDGLTTGDDVNQRDMLWKNKGDNATIYCNHTKGAQYYQMYWYRQLPGETMKLIVFTTTSNTDFGDFNNGKFAATKPDAESGTFTVKNLEPEDKGLYFCAMYWYRQLPGEGMKEIVFTTTTPPHKYESGFSEDKFPATKSDPQTGSLTVEKLLPEDSGVYFCAVSQHSDSGLTTGDDVNQRDMLWKNEGDNATINCNHTKGSGYSQMYWYRQLPGETMKLIVFTTTSNTDFGDFNNGKFAATRPDAESGTFTVKNLEPEDKGLYFCAMYWYRQLPGEGMKQIVYTTTTPPHKYESGFSEDKFPATKSDPQTGSLTVEKLLPEDSGVYFCAVSQHSDSGRTGSRQVNQTSSLLVQWGQSAQMNCSQDFGGGYLEMYWYQQLPGESMKLIAYTVPYSKPDFGDFSPDKFSATKTEPESGSFTVKNVEPGLTDGSDVTQTDILWEKQGDNATMSCSHTKGAGYNRMYWYRQLPGETMKLIVYTTLGITDHDFGEFKGDKFAATKPDFESGTFTVKNLEPEDKGLYFCAVSKHSDTDTFNS
ncbi:hypothetical protein ABVT39_026617 [Epinephelus coioides]